MTPDPTTQRERLVREMLAAAEPFTATAIRDAHPGTAPGTISSLVSFLHRARLLTTVGHAGPNGSGRAVLFRPTNANAVNWPWARLAARLNAPRHRPKRRARRPRRIAVPAASSEIDLVARIADWRRKAAILDRLVADLGLTDTDLTPYAGKE